MQEYQDGSYGEIVNLEPEENKKKFSDLLNDHEQLKNLKAIHFGTVEELEAKKSEAQGAVALEDRVCALEKLVSDLIIRLGVPCNAILVTDTMPGAENK